MCAHERPLTCGPRPPAPVVLPRDAQHRARHLAVLRKRWLAAIFPKAVLGRAEVGVLKIIKVSSGKIVVPISY